MREHDPRIQQADAARRLGVSQSGISNYLNGKRMPDLPVLKTLAEKWYSSSEAIELVCAYLRDAIEYAGVNPTQIVLHPANQQLVEDDSQLVRDIVTIKEAAMSNPPTAAMVHSMAELIRRTQVSRLVADPTTDGYRVRRKTGPKPASA
jgi:transcriptional regulator with XRE-family HTH domain